MDSLKTQLYEGKQLIDSHQVISFDIFDTLIVRDCSVPGDVFDFVEQTYCISHTESGNMDFRNVRINAELACYQQNMIPTLDDIYEQIPFDQSVKEELKLIEIETEKGLCTRNFLGWNLYQYAMEQKKQIIAVSDMYLSSDTLKDILFSNGFQIDQVYSSCEYGKNKKSGQLFDQVIADLNLQKQNIVHIGDNNKSDIIGAKKAQKQRKLLSYFKPKKKDIFADKFLIPFVNNRISFIHDRVSALGFETCGPMVVGFCQWLHAKITTEKYDKVFFCARDAKQTFEIYRTMYPEHKEITDYLYVSLKSLYTPYYSTTGEDQSEYAAQQLDNIRAYLNQIGCKGKIAVIDSGYGGHTQGMLSAILDGQCELHGLYMRISKNFYKNVQDKESYPYMFQAKPEVRSYICGAFFETMISATHGRTNSYITDTSGTITPELGEENPQKELLASFQKGIKLFFEEWSNSILRDCMIPGQAVEDAFLEFAFFPKKEDVMMLGDITGGNESYDSIVIKREKGHYLKHPNDFFKDLKNTYWKGGFLCQCFNSIYPLICRIYLSLDGLVLNSRGF